MSFTAGDVITEVREQVMDETVAYRYSDELLQRKLTQILRRMVIKRPDLFATVDTITCVAGSLQSAPSDSVRLMDVLSTAAGSAPKEINQETLDLAAPAWEAQTPGPAENWSRYPRDPNRFYVYPAAAGGEVLTITYAACPPVVSALTDIITLQDAYMPLVVDGVCWLVESMDAEHVESGRSKMLKDAFDSGLAEGLAARRITDTDTAAGPAEEAV